jgi:nucleoside 2-deoxyribosyltransferase
MVTKVYIAAPSQLQLKCRSVKRSLELHGHKVTSRWIDHNDLYSPSFEVQQAGAIVDLEDVAEADILLAFNPDEFRNSGTGGRHVELGYAIALKKPILLIGERTNVFHYHPLVTFIPDGDFLKAVGLFRASSSI